jgi:hypothetical protein
LLDGRVKRVHVHVNDAGNAFGHEDDVSRWCR